LERDLAVTAVGRDLRQDVGSIPKDGGLPSSGASFIEVQPHTSEILIDSHLIFPKFHIPTNQVIATKQKVRQIQTLINWKIQPFTYL
jgi:hypothetical protein